MPLHYDIVTFPRMSHTMLSNVLRLHLLTILGVPLFKQWCLTILLLVLNVLDTGPLLRSTAWHIVLIKMSLANLNNL